VNVILRTLVRRFLPFIFYLQPRVRRQVQTSFFDVKLGLPLYTGTRSSPPPTQLYCLPRCDAVATTGARPLWSRAAFLLYPPPKSSVAVAFLEDAADLMLFLFLNCPPQFPGKFAAGSVGSFQCSVPHFPGSEILKLLSSLVFLFILPLVLPNLYPTGLEFVKFFNAPFYLVSSMFLLPIAPSDQLFAGCGDNM